MKIFVSSVAKDLKGERDAVTRQILKLGDTPIAMEHFGSTPYPPLEECLGKVEESDLMVLILGPSYGSVHVGTDISYTENEFKHAKQIGIDILAFAVADLKAKIEVMNGHDAAQSYKRFLDAVQQDQTYDTFDSPDQLATAVTTAIANYKKSHGELGRRIAPFTSWQKYFQPLLEPSKIFNHTWHLVGRSEILTALRDFVANSQKVSVLYGPGGVGKSRVLLEFARNFDEAALGCKLLFLTEFAPWTPETISALPSDPVLIVIDDAHRYLDLENALSLARSTQYVSRTKFLLTARPSGKQAIDNAVQRNVDLTEFLNIGKLGPLTREQVRELAEQALDQQNLHYVDRLAGVSWDSPLVTVVGGRLIREKQLYPEIFVTDDDFKKAVFMRFADELTKNLPGTPEVWRKLLVLISALGPVRPTKTVLRDALADYLQVEPWELLERLALLEENGLLLRRGGLVQLSPDVLGDYLLDSASVIAGQDSGFASQIFDRFAAIEGANLLKNLAEVQWRSDQTKAGVDILQGVWAKIKQEFVAAGNNHRLDILKLVEEAAYYQPSQALDVVRLAIATL